MAEAPRSLDIPLTIMVKVGDREPIELGKADMPWPYDVSRALPKALRELADYAERHARP